ncbi:MAG: Coenzyme F420 hydrogenase/dehydrogenase, beta subunit C-terminal domain [Bdellovibrionota bacterium]
MTKLLNNTVITGPNRAILSADLIVGSLVLAVSNKSTLLNILPEESALRDGGAFLDTMNWPPSNETDPPRALRGLAQIVDGGLCHRCGSCVGICPTGVLGLDDQEFPEVKNLSACTDCDLCVKVCPGDEFDYEQRFQEKFNRPAELKNTHGHFEKAVIAYSTQDDLQEKSTSGGLVTGLLLHLIDTGQIDGAIVIASDENVLWKGKPIVARTREEILSTVKSKYAISPTNSVFSEIREIPGKYALVGLPCQIHGFEKAAQLDERIRERVVLTIGLFCHAAIEHEAFEIIWESLGDKGPQAEQFISRIGKHPGAPHLKLTDGSLYPVYFGDKSGFRPSSMEMINILYRLYTPPRCLTCFDALSEFADISVGDPWMPPPEDDVDFYKGWSFGLIRTERGMRAYQELLSKDKIVSKEVTVKEALNCNSHMSSEKRWRAFRVMETHKRQGKSVPAYGDFDKEFPKHSGFQFVKTEGHMLTHIFCFIPKYRAALLRFFLGNGGYSLLWLNNKRRTLKFFLRDTFARWKRKLFGRS